MKNLFRVMLFLSILLLACCISVMAAESGNEIAELKAQIAALQARVEALEADKSKPPAAAPAEKAGLPGNLSFSGYFRGRYQIAQAERNSFDAMEVAFQPKWDVSDKIHGETHLWFYPSTAASPNFYFETAIATFDGIGWGAGAKLIAGKTRNFAYGIVPVGANRIISNYSLYSEAFHHSRITGLQLINKLDGGKLSLNLALMNGYTVRTDAYRKLGVAFVSPNVASSTYPATTTSVLAIGENAIDNNDVPGVSMRLSGNASPELNLGLSALAERISDTETDTVNAFNGSVSSKRLRLHLGLDFRFERGPWLWQSEYSHADLASINFWGLQTGVRYNFDPLNMMFVQYGRLDYDIEPTLNTVTWDKRQINLSFRHMLAPKAWLQLEHEINIEDPPAGAKEIDNDITFIEYNVGY